MAMEASRPAQALRPDVDGRRLLFLAGLHRSGTSLVHRCLADHSAISGFTNTGVHEDEGQHLQSVYRPAHVYGGPGLFGFAPEARLDETSPLATPESARRLLSEWERYWDTTRPVLVEKSPPTLIRTRFFQQLFPGARFIVVLRHPIAVSYATSKWTPRSTLVGKLIRHWLHCHEMFEADRPHLANVFVFRYEDFVAAPEQKLAEMQSFLGLAPEPLRREVHRDVNEKYFARWEKLRRNPIGRWYSKRVVAAYEARVQRFGYSLTDYR